MEQVKLWRLTWTRDCGVFWMWMDTVSAENADWRMRQLARHDAQGAVYTAANRRPRLPDNARALARHPAVIV